MDGPNNGPTDRSMDGLTNQQSRVYATKKVKKRKEGVKKNKAVSQLVGGRMLFDYL